MADAPAADDERALRLTFSYRGDEIELVDAQPVTMFVPPGESYEDRGSTSGFWVELRDEAEGIVFRQDLHHPAAADYEVFPEDPYGEIIRQPAAGREGAFTLIVPEALDAASVVLVASPPRPEVRDEAAAEVARFDMADVRRRAPGLMSASDGTIVGTTQILNNGSPTRLFNIVILSEGYQQAQLGQFATDAAAFVARLNRTAPFHLVMNSINVFRVDVSSTDSGADDPTCGMPPNTCGGGGTTANTYFDARFCGDSANRRLLTVNNALALQVATAQVPQQRLVVVIVNSAIFGGAGGSVAVYSLAANAVDIALHEVGHTAFALADEYEYMRGCGSGETDRNNHPPVEPAAVNVTVTGSNDLSRLKWREYVRAGTALPTTTNANCAQCDPQASPIPAGTVGAFEGADSYHCSSWRPEFDCKMRTLASEFCRVCSHAIISRLRLFSPLSLRLAWKGVGGDQTLYNGRGDDRDQDDLFGFGSSTGPTLVSDNGALMAWKGVGNDQGIYYSRQRHIDGVTWDIQRNVSGVGTSTGPALAMFQGRVHMAWKGAFNDQGIYFNRWDGGLPGSQRNVPGVGTSTRPALAVFRGRLFMAWKGIGGDQSMWFASYDGTTWSGQAPVPNVGTSTYPALAVLNDRLYLVWKGIEGDQSVWFTSFDGTRWAAQAPVPNVGTATGVSLSAGPDRLFLAWSGVAGDPSLYYTTFDGMNWGIQHNYLGTGSSAVPAVLLTF